MIASTNKVKDLIRAAIARCTPAIGEREASAVIHRLMEDKYGITRLSMALEPGLAFSESQIVNLHKDLQKLDSGMPVQYITGIAWFAGLRLNVSAGVLIPRPETEELVETAADLLKSIHSPVIVDVGTGSGAIAIALRKKHPNSRVIATDLSETALNIARQNAHAHDADILFLLNDILTEPWPLDHKVDCIISNPPYIPHSEMEAMQKQVKDFEPKLALFVEDSDPLLFYRKIGATGMKHLTRNGALLLEIHSPLAGETAELLSELGYRSVKIRDDIHGKPRVLVAFM